jgi:hypothetical protein
MTKIGMALLALMWTGSAWAGCSNWAEDADFLGAAPRANVCISGACEETTLDYNCGNATGAQWGYKNGLKVETSADGFAVAFKDDHEVALGRVDCAAIDEGACFIRPNR